MIDINYKIDLEIIKRYSKGILDRINNTFLDSDFYRNIFKFSVLRFEIGVATAKVSRLLRRIEKLKKIDPELRNKKELYNLINKYLDPSKVEVKGNGEVFTPFWLIDKMLDTLPAHVWTNPNLRWFDPASGIGNFQVVILSRLMVGLKDVIKDENERYKHIMENMIYTCDISDKNTFLYKNIFDPNNELKLNHFYGDFLSPEFDEHMKNVWKVEKFDVIVGNPPYQILKPGFKKTQPLWHKFVEKSLSILNEDKYMSLIHPGGWRNIVGAFKDTQNLLKSKQILTLEIHTFKDGLDIFGFKTNFDFYCLKNTDNDSDFLTKIICEDNSIENLNIKNVEFLPGENINEIFSLVAKDGEEKVTILSNSDYHTQKSHVVKEKSDIYNLPCVYMVSYLDVPTFWYTNIDKGHFGIPKVIWANGSTGVIVDNNGEYGVSQFAYAICDEQKNLNDICKALKSEKFIKKIMLFKSGLGDKYNRKVIATFRKDFWKDFI